MTTKKVMKEDYYPEGASVPTFRAGEEVDEVHIKMYGLEDLVAGAKTQAAHRARRSRSHEDDDENGSANPGNVQDTGVGE